jgi:hypothetical protein
MLVGLTAGVTGRIVGVELVVWGILQAIMAMKSTITMLRRDWLRGETMQAIITLLGEKAIQNEKQAPAKEQ